MSPSSTASSGRVSSPGSRITLVSPHSLPKAIAVVCFQQAKQLGGAFLALQIVSCRGLVRDDARQRRFDVLPVSRRIVARERKRILIAQGNILRRQPEGTRKI